MLQQTQPELTFTQSEQPQTTPYRTVVHDHGRYQVITGDKFFHNSYPYPINTTDRSGVRLDILTPIAVELDAMLSAYSRVYLTRFDLRLPAGTPVDIANEWVSQLFKKLRERLKSKFHRPKGLANPVINFTYGWVREKEMAKQVHYHCWIALPHRQIKRLGTPTSGIAGAITEIWANLSGGEATLVELPKSSDKYTNHYVIERGKPETLEGPILWLSYLAKERGKYQTGKGDRVHSTSQLRNKKT
ncbi:YagK/YfjJ domain-containing protein [Raoultella ornithinolytica]|uniref:YagK/YfjJ domain-containing protein n=1 Tax=Raoultella ornithinolytica TaxID=54291 RepID=UPI000E5822B2|nr:inovirus-type Gp2 protein [Raoultella ornithinolytica]HEC2579716.1 inovirus-type Gp2 protein [Raoultella ornithinolytica]HEC2585575.1 inovirus-type Gp2 protein [Raoultella ornithinolytica]HEC2621475.1 inovirus-type Gp2 protein [Raoultella ornithinolytica]